ncbi:MAG: sialidase family protein [Planctomycetota bacterium]
MNPHATLILPLAALALLLVSPPVSAQNPEAANLIEHRGEPPTPARGDRKVDSGIEISSPVGNINGMYELDDGRLVVYGNGGFVTSADGGRSWSALSPLPVIHWPFRMKDGKLGGCAFKMSWADPWNFLVSADEWKTYETRGRINVGEVPGVPYSNAFVQTKSGRILFPVRFVLGAAHDGIYAQERAWGTIKGKREPIEGHAQYPEPDNTFVFYSDDEGRTWSRSEGGIMIWHKDGFGGMWPCDEPCLVELTTGDLLLFLRTSLGRVYTSHSGPAEWDDLWGEPRAHHSAPPGHRWDLPLPTELASSYSPCKVRRIPSTGDLLIVWNQVSGDEIRAGYRRGRLSCAVSRDDGKTWEHFRTLDRVVLPPAGRVAPDPEPGMARAFKYVGDLPDDYGAVDYPDIGFWKDQIIITWGRACRNPRPGDVQGLRMRVTPVEWFYQDEPPLEAPKPAPRLMLVRGTRTAEIPGVFCDDRFFVKLSDVAAFTGDPIEADMFAPVNQALTFLGYKPSYDDTRLKDPDHPRLVATIGKKE